MITRRGWSRWRGGSGWQTAEAAEGEDPAGALYRGEAKGRCHWKGIMCVQGYPEDQRQDGGGWSHCALFRACSADTWYRCTLLAWYLLIKIEFLDISCQSWLKTLLLLMFGKVYIYLNTHPLTRSQQYPPSHKCHINTPFLRVRYQAKKRRKVTRTRSPTRFDIVFFSKKSPGRRPPAALPVRGFCIQMIVQNLFTTISSKTCTEHVNNLSPAVPRSSPCYDWDSARLLGESCWPKKIEGPFGAQ